MARRKLDQKRVVLTGASSGIGFELAKQLLEKGCRLVATARRQERLKELQAFTVFSNQLEMVSGDIVSAKLRQSLIDKAITSFGGVDILINNAGVGGLGPFEKSTEESLRKIMEVNFFAPVELTRIAIPILRKGVSPIIVNISSVLGHRAVPEKSEYCASKFAIHGFSDSLRAELKGEIDLLLVSPSTTQGEFFEHAVENHSDRDWTPKKAMSPATVAKKSIQAIVVGKHEIVLTIGGKSLVFLDNIAPTLTNKLVQRFG